MKVKIAIRTFFREKIHTSITLATLALGMAVVLILIQYVNNQINFDSFFSNSGRVYRIERTILENKEEVYSSIYTFPALNLELLSSYPDVESATKVITRSGIVAYGTKAFREDNMIHADENFLEIFNLEFLEGSSYNSLKEPNTIIISESFKDKYFDGEALGKSIRIGGEEIYKITGVYLDIAKNSHFNFKAILSYNTYSEYDRIMSSWTWNRVRTYVKIKPNVKLSEFASKLTSIEAKMPKLGSSKMPQSMQLSVIPLTSIHYLEFDTSSVAVLWGLVIIAIIIMIVGWLNYLNLLLSKVSQNRTQVAIKKAIGASYYNFTMEQLTVASIYLILSVLIGVALVSLIIPQFNAEFDSNIALFSIETRSLTLLLIGVYAGVNIIISLIPLNIIKSTKTSFPQAFNNVRGAKPFLVRPNSLLVFQFTIVTFTIGSVVAIDNQVAYMNKVDKHFESENILIIEPPDLFDDEYNQAIKLFKNSCAEFHNVRNVSVLSSVPGQRIEDYFVNQIHVSGFEPPEKTFFVNWSDEHYVATYGFGLIRGNPMISATTERNAILNQSAVSILKQDPIELIGKYIITPYDSARIVGIIRDFNQSSLKNEFEPQIIISDPDAWGYISILFSSEISEVDIENVATLWTQVFADSPFEYTKEEVFFKDQYGQEARFMRLLYFISILSISISTIGLLGFTLGQIEISKKPFAIRKVFGSSELNIGLLISKKYFKNIFYAFLITIPTFYYINREWLQSYSFHDSVKPNVLLVPLLIVFIICSFSIGLHYLFIAKTSLTEQLHEN